MDEKKKKEIREMENAGLDVISIDSQGKMDYATRRNESSEYCDSCQFLKFEADPDPHDWFRDDDQKAICTKMNAKIEGSLEPRELTNILKPCWCPYLGRELTDLEKKIFKNLLSIAKETR